MKKVLILIIGAVLSSNSFAVSTDYINKAFSEISKEVGVNESLLRAICYVESNHKPYLYRYADASLNNHAFGICQVLYFTAQHMGLKDPKCLNDFSDLPIKDRTYESCKLFGPRTNIRYAALYLKSRLEKYDNNEFQAIAAYNSGTYKVCRDGWLYANKVRFDGSYGREKFKRCIKDGPINFYYINRVLKALEKEV